MSKGDANRKKHRQLDGAALDSATMMAMLELLNGCVEPGELSYKEKEHYGFLKPRIGNTGRIFVTSTAGDDKDNWAKEIWMDSHQKNEDSL